MGVGISQHHPGFALVSRRLIRLSATACAASCGVSDVLMMDATGTRHLGCSALTDSGTNHDTGMAILIAEMLGISDIDNIKAGCGAIRILPTADRPVGGGPHLQGAGRRGVDRVEELKAELFKRAAA